MKQDRFLLGILVGIAVLVLLALLVFFLRPDGLQYGADDTPEGVVRNFIVAIHLQDYQKAYDYLAEDDYKPTFDQFSQPFQLKYINPTNAGIEIVGASISAEQGRATVQVSVIYNARDPFAGSYRSSDQALLILQSGQWKVQQMPHPFWFYDWYLEPYKEVRP
jgi:hypothetical protein